MTWDTARKSAYGLALAFVQTFGAAHADGQHVELAMKAEKEIVVIDANGEKKIARVEAQQVLPGEEVIYTITYRNKGTTPATDVVIGNPVPQHTTYTGNSAFGKGTRIDFSVDGGKRYGVPEKLTVIGPDGKPRRAAPEEYTHVRWTVDTALAPGGEGVVGYRARLK